jgi:hypothetical protein
MIFNGQSWLNLHQIMRMTLNSVKRWRIVFKNHMTAMGVKNSGKKFRTGKWLMDLEAIQAEARSEDLTTPSLRWPRKQRCKAPG